MLALQHTHFAASKSNEIVLERDREAEKSREWNFQATAVSSALLTRSREEELPVSVLVKLPLLFGTIRLSLESSATHKTLA